MGPGCLERFLEETSDTGLASYEVSAVKLKGFVFKCGKSITKCFGAKRPIVHKHLPDVHSQESLYF